MKRIFKFLLIFLIFSSYLSAVMLVGTYKNENLTGWVMSEKFDGVRAIWNGKKLLSRNGNEIYAPKEFLALMPPFAIDGELWTKRNDFENAFSIVSKINPDKNEWKNIKYMIFDVPNEKGGLFDRLGVLEQFLQKNPNKNIFIIEQKNISSNDEALKFFNEVVKKGGEGIVVTNPKAIYEDKRSKNILKIKKFQDAECEVLALNEGKGKYENMLGSITCKDIKSGRIFKIGSGFSDEERKKGFEIGEIITYKYQNLTKNGKPRFPVFLRVRKDFKF